MTLWPTVLFLWANVVGVIALVVWLSRATTSAVQRAADEKAAFQREILQQYQALTERVGQSSTVVAEEMRRLLASAIANHQGQIQTDHAAIKGLAEAQGEHALKVLQTCLAAQETEAGHKQRPRRQALREAFNDINRGANNAPPRRTIPANLQ